ncbi:MAG: hypothetical protein J7K08_01565 [Thermoplasmata archaeon]|nr:hypothetical protein [Thermoplasmata archaeon]
MKWLKEGEAEFLAEVSGGERGPGKRSGVFYNPAMKLSRDLTVLVAAGLMRGRGEILFFDALAGSGVRGLRVLKEGPSLSGGRVRCIFSDISRDAAESIEKSLKRNSAEGEVFEGDARELFHTIKADFLDIDPYGSPAPYLPEALRSVRHGGILAITATDTAPLSGTYPTTCLRRYLAWSEKVEFLKEMALRILLGYAVRVAASRDVCLKPLLSYYKDHYLRAFLQVSRSRGRAREALGSVAHILLRRGSLGRRVVWIYRGGWEKPRDLQLIGPLWVGETSDVRFLKGLKDLPAGERYGEALSLVDTLSEETGYPPWYYEVNEVARALRSEPLSMEKVKERLGEGGFRFSRTHYSATAFKTDAPGEQLEEILYGGGI